MNKELLTTDWTLTSGTATFSKTAEGLKLEGGLGWIHTDFIPLPTGTGITYEYDIEISLTANDQIYFQIERFDSDKGSISNNAATNCISGYKPTADVEHVRYIGTIDLATFNGGTATAFIKARACNGYSSTSGTLVINNWSLKAVAATRANPSITKNGQLKVEQSRENYLNASFNKNGLIEGQHLYEY